MWKFPFCTWNQLNRNVMSQQKTWLYQTEDYLLWRRNRGENGVLMPDLSGQGLSTKSSADAELHWMLSHSQRHLILVAADVLKLRNWFKNTGQTPRSKIPRLAKPTLHFCWHFIWKCSFKIKKAFEVEKAGQLVFLFRSISLYTD